MHTRQVLTVHPDTAELNELAQLDDQPSGLCWTADGALTVSSMLDNKVYQVGAHGMLGTAADVSLLTDWPTSESCVSRDCHDYLGKFEYDFYNQ